MSHSTQRQRNVLLVLEKPAVAIAWVRALLRSGHPSFGKGNGKRSGKNRNINLFRQRDMEFPNGTPIYSVTAPFEGENVTWFITSVRGHIRDVRFARGGAQRGLSLFDRDLEEYIREDSADIKGQLEDLIQKHSIQVLLLGMDNDLEGEHISQEVADVVQPFLAQQREVRRAVFTSLSPQCLLKSLSALRSIDSNKVAAVAVRRELDYRLGQALTRDLNSFVRCNSDQLQEVFSTKLEEDDRHAPLLSYGPCQTPALLFVVQHFLRRLDEQEKIAAAPTRHRIRMRLRSDLEALSEDLDLEEAQRLVKALEGMKADSLRSLLLQYEESLEPLSDFLQQAKEQGTCSEMSSKDVLPLDATPVETCFEGSSQHAPHITSTFHDLEMSGAETLDDPKHLLPALISPDEDSKHAEGEDALCMHVTRLWSTLAPGLERPRPLDTITLLELAAVNLGFKPDWTAKLADKLYYWGLISYPRTESSVYGDDFDIKEVLTAFSSSWEATYRGINELTIPGQQSTSLRTSAFDLLRSGHESPRTDGQQKGDHEPITPVAMMDNADSNMPFEVRQEMRALLNSEAFARAVEGEDVYDEEGERRMIRDCLLLFNLICRYFLATVAPDSIIEVQTAELQANQHLHQKGVFKVRQRYVREMGWLKYFPLQRAMEQVSHHGEQDNVAVALTLGQALHITGWMMKAEPKPDPPALTMAELLEQMRNHGIGTDATVAEHVATLLNRNFAVCSQELRPQAICDWDDEEISIERKLRLTTSVAGTLEITPTHVGKVLCAWFWRHQRKLILPSVRSEVEADYLSIAYRGADAQQVLRESLVKFKNAYASFSNTLQPALGMDLVQALRGCNRLVLSLNDLAGLDWAALLQWRTDATGIDLPECERSTHQGQRETCSAPADSDLNHCLLPGTQVLTRQEGVRTVMDAFFCYTGHILESGCAMIAVISSCVELPERDRDVVTISFKAACHDSVDTLTDVSLCLTASHVLPVLPTHAERNGSMSFRPVPMAEVKLGFKIRTLHGDHTVHRLEPPTGHTEFCHTGVLQIELSNDRNTMFVAKERGVPPSVFVEVYGELPPATSKEKVKLLRFSRFEKFKEALLESAELRPCRDALTANGFSADLRGYGLGAGKLFVHPAIAPKVLERLQARGEPLRAGDVAVSRAFEHIVLEAVRRRERTRPAHPLQSESTEWEVQWQPPLFSNITALWNSVHPLALHGFGDGGIVVHRTFLFVVKEPAPEEARSTVTRSTTDAHNGQNPRVNGFTSCSRC